jgi:hypothetical protein
MQAGETPPVYWGQDLFFEQNAFLQTNSRNKETKNIITSERGDTWQKFCLK